MVEEETPEETTSSGDESGTTLSPADEMRATLLAFICILKGIPGIDRVDQEAVYAAIDVMTPLKAPKGTSKQAKRAARDVFKKIGGSVGESPSPT